MQVMVNYVCKCVALASNIVPATAITRDRFRVIITLLA